MPIPELRGKITREDTIAKYAEYNWYKTIEYDWVEKDGRTNRFVKKRYRYRADTMPCSSEDDAQFALTFVSFMSSGAYWTCAMCRRTTGPLAFKDGQLVSEEEITLDEAWDIVMRTGQIRPLGMSERKSTQFQIVM